MRFTKRITGAFFIAVIILATGFSTMAQTTGSREYQVKAVFLFNFIQFVEWPPETFDDNSSPFVIGVLGDDPFGAVLDKTVLGEMIKGRPIVTERYKSIEEIKACHLLFISPSEKSKIPETLDKLNGNHILTVGDTNDFARLGGIVNFTTKDDKIQLLINLESAKAAGLDISSKLLRLSKIVSTKES